MTLPDERYRAVQAARQLLEEIARDQTRWPRVSRELRLAAAAVLRHYPTELDMQVAAVRCPHTFYTSNADPLAVWIREGASNQGQLP